MGSSRSASPAVRLLAIANHRVPVPPAAVLNSVLVLESLERLFESVLEVVGQLLDESVPRQVFVRVEAVEEPGFEAVSPRVRVLIRAFRRVRQIETYIWLFEIYSHCFRNQLYWWRFGSRFVLW